MVWITMSVALHVGNRKRKKSDSKPHSQINKCLNEKRRREQENIHIEELAELVSASPSDMSSLSCKPDKCAILKETVNQIRSQKKGGGELCDDLQQSEVSSSKPSIINNQIFGHILLEALEGFLFVVNIDGKVEFVSDNISTFLKYFQEEVYERNIYDFIHPEDQSRFNSNLLLMMPLGNGRDWQSGKPTKHFNCRFLIKQDKSMDEPQYENLNITANYIPLGDNGNNEEIRSGLTCIARRVAFEDKRMAKVEQFTSRIDREGKVVQLDVSMLPLASSEYLNKELCGATMLDFCHPADQPTFKQHLKETFESECATSPPYKLRVGGDKFMRITTKSRRFRCPQTNEEYIMSCHSVIRESDVSGALETHKSLPSPSPSTSSASGSSSSASDSSTSVNGILSPPLAHSYYSNSSVSVVSSNVDFALNDLVLDMFPNSNWNPSKECDNSPLSHHSEVPPPSPGSSAFVMASSSRSGSTAPSPAAVQSRAPTPFGGSCYSPSTSSGGRNSPPRAPKPPDSMNSATAAGMGAHQAVRQQQQFDLKSNQKLRNLLTQSGGGGEAPSPPQPSAAVRQQQQDDIQVLTDLRLDSRNRTSDVMLRGLLNQEEEEVPPVEPIQRGDPSSSGPPGKEPRVGNNNMLRQLLNNTDNSERNYHKNPDLIHQLLMSNSNNNVKAFQNSRPTGVALPRLITHSVPKQQQQSNGEAESSLKRKTNDKMPLTGNPPTKKPHAHLAGQNPMLASMLASGPKERTAVEIPDPRSIMNELPQERLPKDLKEKLVHTPVTTTSPLSTVFTTTTQRQFTVAADSRGALQQQHPQIMAQQLNKTIYSPQLPDDDILLAKSPEMSAGNNVQNTFSQLLTAFTTHHFAPTPTSTLGVVEEGAALQGGAESSQTGPDGNLDSLLETINSLLEDHKIVSSQNASNPASILRSLSEESVTPPPPPSSTQSLDDRLAISRIQRELMEAGSAASSSRPPNAVMIPSQSTRPQMVQAAQLTAEQILMIQQHQQQQQQLLSGATIQSNYGRVRLPLTSQANGGKISAEMIAQVQRKKMQMARAAGVANLNAQVTLPMKQKQLYLQQQQKRLLQQAQRQQLSEDTVAVGTSAAYTENLNDLLNNSVAPNVTVLRASDIPGLPGSARFTTSSSQPAQLSPGGQRISPNYAASSSPPVSTYQQQAPPSYPQSSSSPHLAPPPAQWNQRLSISPVQNLQQLQNPMLNAQLSQQAGSNQIRQQRSVQISRIYTQQSDTPVMVLQTSPQQQQTTQQQLAAQQQAAQQQAVQQQAAQQQAAQQHAAQQQAAQQQAAQQQAVQQQAAQQQAVQQQAAQQQAVQQQAVQQQQRIQRARIASGSQQNQLTSFSTASPLPSPSYSQPTSTFVSISTSGVPVTYSVAGQQFTFDRQNIVYSTSNSTSDQASLQMGSQNRLLVANNSPNQPQQLLSVGGLSQLLDLSTLTKEELEALSLNILSAPSSTEQQPSSLYAQALLTDAALPAAPQPPNSPRHQQHQPEEQPKDQKKSLLQQLLSEPT